MYLHFSCWLRLAGNRSEERRVGKERRSRWSPSHYKKKTAYEIKECYWRSDVCSSDLDIECFAGGFNVDSNVLAFFLLAETGWKYGVGTPYLKDYAPPPFTSKALWRMAYAIPYYDDSHGATGKLWSTGMAIANKGASSVPILFTYTIGQNYTQAGQQYKISYDLPVNGLARFDLLQGNSGQNIPGLSAAGYPAELNSEGHVDMTSRDSSLLEVSSIIAPSSYAEFMVEQAEAY